MPAIAPPVHDPSRLAAELPTALVPSRKPGGAAAGNGGCAPGCGQSRRHFGHLYGPEELPRSIDRYLLVAPLGRGGMGEVFRAHDALLGRTVAVKLIAADHVGDERTMREFEREWRLAAAIEHPHVLPIYDAGEADGRPFLAMRYVDGHDLERLLAAEGPLAPHRALNIASQVASALDALHERGLVHRDVKPTNVLMTVIDGRDHAYLSDFGVAAPAAAGHRGDALTGTPGYIAPEQLRGEPVDARADVYALGCLLFALLAGRGPFTGLSRDQTIIAQLIGHAPTLRGLGVDVPVGVDRVIGRAMQTDPDRRYGTAGELVHDASDALIASGAKHRSGRSGHRSRPSSAGRRSDRSPPAARGRPSRAPSAARRSELA